MGFRKNLDAFVAERKKTERQHDSKILEQVIDLPAVQCGPLKMLSSKMSMTKKQKINGSICPQNF